MAWAGCCGASIVIRNAAANWNGVSLINQYLQLILFSIILQDGVPVITGQLYEMFAHIYLSIQMAIFFLTVCKWCVKLFFKSTVICFTMHQTEFFRLAGLNRSKYIIQIIPGSSQTVHGIGLWKMIGSGSGPSRTAWHESDIQCYLSVAPRNTCHRMLHWILAMSTSWI